MKEQIWPWAQFPFPLVPHLFITFQDIICVSPAYIGLFVMVCCDYGEVGKKVLATSSVEVADCNQLKCEECV